MTALSPFYRMLRSAPMSTLQEWALADLLNKIEVVLGFRPVYSQLKMDQGFI